MPKFVSDTRSSAWISRAAVFEIAFSGMIFIGFIVWMMTSIAPVIENDSDSRHWLIPLRNAISQPVGSIIGIVGGVLLLRRQRIGLYISAAAIPILLINFRMGVGFISAIDWLIIPSYLTYANTEVAQATASTIISIWTAIYAVSLTAIAGLLAICWKRVRM